MGDDIVKQLRAMARFESSPHWELRAAADFIEAQQAEIERLRTALRLIYGETEEPAVHLACELALGEGFNPWHYGHSDEARRER